MEPLKFKKLDYFIQSIIVMHISDICKTACEDLNPS